MRYSLTNYVETADISATGIATDVVPVESTLYDPRTTRSYVAEQDGSGDVVITIDMGSESDVDMVALVGMTGITGSITIAVKYLTSTLDSEVVTIDTPVQQNYAVARFATLGADEVTITLNVGSGNQFSIGYLYVGELSELLDIKDDAINYSIVSTDPRNITRAGVPLTSPGYIFADVELTFVEMTFSTARSHVVLWATDGYAYPRLWYFEEENILTNECIYAILDSERLQLDPIYMPGEEAKSELTIGLTEVF